jgi:hypothetical protein
MMTLTMSQSVFVDLSCVLHFPYNGVLLPGTSLTLLCQASLRRFIIDKGPETLHRYIDVM